MTPACKTDAGPSGRTLPSLTPIDIGHFTHRIRSLGRQCPWWHMSKQISEPREWLEVWTCSSSDHEQFKVHFAGSEKRGGKAPTFIFTDCAKHFQVITALILQQPHTAGALFSSWDIWGNWGTDSKSLAEVTHVVNGGTGLAFQDWSCCGVFRDGTKLIKGPWGQSRASSIQSWKLEARYVRGPDKWILTLGSLWESNKTYGLPLQSTWVFPASLFLSHTHSQKYTHIPKSEFPRQ